GIRSRRIVVGAGDADVVAFDWTHLEHVQRLALWNALDHVHQYHVTQFFIREIDCAARANIAPAHYGDFVSHVYLRVFSLCLLGFFAGFLTSLVKQKVKRLVGADMPGDARQAAFLLEFRAGNGQGFALLAGDSRNFAIDLFLRWRDGFAFADLIQ